MGKRAEPATDPNATPAPAATATPAKVTPAKAGAKPKATPKPKAEKVVAVDGEKKGRKTRGDRGHLAADIEAVLRGYEAGKLKVEGALTVHRVAGLITYSDDSHPSTGAVSAAFDRWEGAGYIKVTGKPKAFDGFPAKWSAAKEGNLAKFLEAEKNARAKARAAAKAA